MNKYHPLLDNGPVREASKLKFGDHILIRSQYMHVIKPWRVTHVSDFIQITDMEYTWSTDYKTLSFEQLNEMGFEHYGHDAPIWKTIITFGACKIEKF